MPTKDKEKQERRSLINIADNFRKVIVVKDDIKRKIDDDGVVTIGLFDFLLDEQSIERY
jgi:predicted AAA+ superfamily ATPase